MASVAVLSDIHGVLPALDAVLAAPAVPAADRIVLTGDIAAGPQPVPVLDRLLGLGPRVTWVRGNPGSVGMPYGRAGAHWALLADGAVTLRRTVYDAGAACAAIRDQSGYPDAAEWADYFVHARASDADALGAFAPRDGRAQS